MWKVTCYGGAGFVFATIQANVIECPLKEIYYYCQLSKGAFTMKLVCA